MGLFANWKALVSGFPSVLDWNRYTKAIALMRGQNGVRVFLQNGGAVIEGDVPLRKPFEARQISETQIEVYSGYLLNRPFAASYKEQSPYTILTIPTGVSGAEIYQVHVVYDLGRAVLSGTWSAVAPAWLKVSTGPDNYLHLQGGTLDPLGTYDAAGVLYESVIIATINTMDSVITSIGLNHVGSVACPDPVAQGTMVMANWAFDGAVNSTNPGWIQAVGECGAPDMTGMIPKGSGLGGPAYGTQSIADAVTTVDVTAGSGSTVPIASTSIQAGIFQSVAAVNFFVHL